MKEIIVDAGHHETISLEQVDLLGSQIVGFQVQLTYPDSKYILAVRGKKVAFVAGKNFWNEGDNVQDLIKSAHEEAKSQSRPHKFYLFNSLEELAHWILE